MSDIYIVTNGPQIIGASTRQQGAELIAANYCEAVADAVMRDVVKDISGGHDDPRWQNEYRVTRAYLSIHDVDLQDDDE